MSFRIEDEVYDFLKQEPFYAELSLHVEKRESKEIPTAGVGINKRGDFTLFYNKEWVSNLSQDKKRGLFIHEMNHILYEHLTDRVPSELKNKTINDKLSKNECRIMKLWNIATDLAINSNIPMKFLPEGGFVPGHGKFTHFKKGKTSEQYYEMVSSSSEFDEIGSGFDEHCYWAEDSELKEIAKAKLSKILKDIVQQRNGFGTMSEELQKKLSEKYSGRINWKAVLRYFLESSVKCDSYSTFKRLNRKYPMIHPGRRFQKSSNILIAIDQSGSVSNDLLLTFFAEISNLLNEVSFTVLFFDTKVDENSIKFYEKGSKIELDRVFSGGTCFQAPVDWAENKKFDGLIIMTDLQAPKPTNKIKTLWVSKKSDYESCDWINFYRNSFIYF